MGRPQVLTQYQNRSITKIGFAVMAFFMLSFAYELPIANLTGKDRLNPRLFDVAAIVLIVYWVFAGRSLGWRIDMQHPIVRLWVWITAAFGFAAAASIAWIPLDIYLFTIFYMFKYVICLCVVLIFSSIPFDESNKRKLCWVIMLGGFWTSLVAFLQFFGYWEKQRFLPGGEEIALSWHGIFSTLGVTYWHLGMYSLMCFVVAIALFFSEKSLFRKILLLCLAAMFTFSIVVCGSRAAIAALGLAMALLVFRKGFKNILLGVIIVLMAIGVGQYFYGMSGTKARVDAKSNNTAENRIWTGPITLMKAFDYHGPKLLITGGGFYVVPLPNAKGELKYRKGYGNHNIYLFPLEQAGLLAFILGLLMWYQLLKLMRRFSKERTLSEFSRGLAKSVYIYIMAMLLVGIAGQVFWFGFGTENFTAFQVIMFIFASTVPINCSQNVPAEQQG